ncbi:L,D-transpeptidase [Starkeya sp. ORNL1]|uniref:L,D-transpeptidase n=1 Tax=Starkeya sp. ORNL1 TaxID=2709380 RepID=UPI001FEF975A|nr:L,D-transpeptidase [Starkeya sp. ORNL1]
MIQGTDKTPMLSRRAALRLGTSVFGGLALAGLMPALAQTDPDMAAIAAMKPGEFVWYPERAPEGFVAIVVSLPDQRAYVYRNGIRIGATTVSTGKEGHQTPVGVFTILEKDVTHHSSIYNEASMPYTERLTWSGVALHAGGLPGYPSSHGCIHLPIAFAKLVFGVTHYGTPVIVADNHSQPMDVLHPGLLLTADADKAIQAAEATAKATPGPTAQESANAAELGAGAVAMVVSGADKTLTVMKGGDVAFTAPVTIRDPQTPLGNVVYVLKNTNGDIAWTAFAYEGNSVQQGKPANAIDRITVAPDANKTLASLLVPGSTMLVTDLPAHPGTRTDEDFVIMDHEATS